MLNVDLASVRWGNIMHSIRNDILRSLFPNGKYLTYKFDKDTNILLTAPHGGRIKPYNIAYRKYGNRSIDSYTRRLTEKIEKRLIAIKGISYVMADIHRSRVDLNRNIEEAAQGDLQAEKIWTDWNTIIKYYQRQILQKFGNCLYIDIHSHNSHDKFELGFGMPNSEYLELLNTGNTDYKSTVDSLGRDKLYDVVFGENSLHKSIESFGFKVKIPTLDGGYYSGGRNIRVFSGKGTSAIQVEAPISLLRYYLDDISEALAESIIKFHENFYVKSL